MHAHFWLIAVAALVSNRCEESSLHPVYEERDLVTDPRILGTWYSGDSHQQLVVDSARGKTYHMLSIYREDTTEFELRLARAEGLLLGDMVLVQQLDDVVSLHQYAILQLTDSTAVYSYLCDGWLDKYLDEHPKELAFAVVDSAHLITAEPRAIQRFLRRHRGDPKAWDSLTVSRSPLSAEQESACPW